jgi:HEAT repeat protein
MDAVPVLIRGLTDDMRNVREAAIVALDRVSTSLPGAIDKVLPGLTGTPAAEAVAGALGCSDPAISQAAVRLLRGAGDARFAPRLLALFENELLREEAAAALVVMGRWPSPAGVVAGRQQPGWPSCYILGGRGVSRTYLLRSG